MATTAPETIVSFQIDLSALSGLGHRLEGAQPVILNTLESAMHTVVNRAQRVAVQGAKRDTGDLRRHITNKVERTADSVKGEIGSNAQHAATIEEGRGVDKKWPPPGALLGWMARKHIPVSTAKVGGSRRIRNADGEHLGYSTRTKKTKGYYPVEYLIARKIGKKGFEGDHNMRKAVDSVEPFARELFAQVGPRVVRQIIKGTPT